MKNLLFIFITSILLINYSVSAADFILPNPKPPELTDSEKAQGSSDIVKVRAIGKRLFKAYAEEYNKEFNKKNNINFVLMTEDGMKSYMYTIDQASEQELKKPVEEITLVFKRELDRAALAAMVQIKNQSNIELKMLGVTIDEVSSIKLKLAQEEDKNKQLSLQLSKLEVETNNLKKTNSELAFKIEKLTTPTPQTVAEPAVAQPVPVLDATSNKPPASTTNTTKMAVLGLILVGAIGLFFKFKG